MSLIFQLLYDTALHFQKGLKQRRSFLHDAAGKIIASLDTSNEDRGGFSGPRN
jgi:hypothetical protein